MPRYKKSLGKVILKTVFRKEFNTWLRKEVQNLRDWNPRLINKYSNIFTFYNGTKVLWSIDFNKKYVEVTSEEPVVYLGAGLRILMGSGKLELY